MQSTKSTRSPGRRSVIALLVAAFALAAFGISAAGAQEPPFFYRAVIDGIQDMTCDREDDPPNVAQVFFDGAYEWNYPDGSTLVVTGTYLEAGVPGAEPVEFMNDVIDLGPADTGSETVTNEELFTADPGPPATSSLVDWTLVVELFVGEHLVYAQTIVIDTRGAIGEACTVAGVDITEEFFDLPDDVEETVEPPIEELEAPTPAEPLRAAPRFTG